MLRENDPLHTQIISLWKW